MKNVRRRHLLYTIVALVLLDIGVVGIVLLNVKPTHTGRPTALGAPLPLAALKEMNYFPARNSWRLMWRNWDPATIDADFARIAALHANTVRINIDTYAFGYPTPQPARLGQLAQIVVLAQAHGLRVHLTLFEQWSAFGDLDGSERWARAILDPYAGDPRIAFVDLKNEIDLAGDPAAYAWARQMVPYVRGLADGIPVTLSFSGKDGASGFQRFLTVLGGTRLDFYDYHFYTTWAPQNAYSTLKQARQMVAPALLFVGETGVSTCACNTLTPQGLPATTAFMEAYQDHYYRIVAYAARALGLPPPAPWILSDFAPGTLTEPGPGGIENNYGLYRLDGTPKPAAATVSAFFGAGTVDTSFNNGFEHGVLSGAVELPAKWMLWHASEGHFALDRTVAHTGQASARISNSTGDSGGLPSFYISPVAEDIVPGHVYTVSVWARGLDATGRTNVSLA